MIRSRIFETFFGPNDNALAGIIRTLLITTMMVSIGFINSLQASDQNFPFYPGEKLTFELKWAFIPAGEAVLEVLPLETVQGVTSYHFALTVRSNAFIDNFYKVRDRIDAFADLEMTHALLYKQKQQEGTTQRDIVVNFSWEKFQAQYTNFNNQQAPIDIFPGSFDPLSAFYFVRLFEPKKKLMLERPVTDGKKCIIGKAFFIKKETVTVAAGTYDTYLMEPETEKIGGVFEKSQGAKIQIWITADQRRIPVKIKSKVVVGSFTGELVSVTGLK